MNPAAERILWHLSMVAAPLICYGIIYLIKESIDIPIRRTIKREEDFGLRALIDSRPPILYLRNFTLDGSHWESSETDFSQYNFKYKFNLPKFETYKNLVLNHENEIRKMVDDIGPLLSVGRYNVQDLGISRINTSDSNWKYIVGSNMKVCPMILLRTSGPLSVGVEWECKQIFNTFLNKTVFIVEDTESQLYRHVKNQIEKAIPPINNEISRYYDVPFYIWISNDKKFYKSKSISKLPIFQELRKAKVSHDINKFRTTSQSEPLKSFISGNLTTIASIVIWIVIIILIYAAVTH